MKIRFDNFLLCILWLLAMTLGTSFWFGTIYGFDIFSSAHWEYISYLQASQTPIKTSFYISVAIVIFMTIFGMYLILRPHMRKIRLPIVKTAPPPTKTPVQSASPQTRDNTQNNDASTLDVLPGQMQPATTSPAPQRPTTPAGLSRPPRLVLPTLNGGYIHAPASPTLTGPTPTQYIARNIHIGWLCCKACPACQWHPIGINGDWHGRNIMVGCNGNRDNRNAQNYG